MHAHEIQTHTVIDHNEYGIYSNIIMYIYTVCTKINMSDTCILGIYTKYVYLHSLYKNMSDTKNKNVYIYIVCTKMSDTKNLSER